MATRSWFRLGDPTAKTWARRQGFVPVHRFIIGFVVFALIGALLGFVIDRAYAEPGAPASGTTASQLPYLDGCRGSCECAAVKGAKDAQEKANKGKLPACELCGGQAKSSPSRRPGP